VSAECPEEHLLLRGCTACGTPINRAISQYVTVSPSWRRCNDLLCRECWSTIMRAADVVIGAALAGEQIVFQLALSEN
jgi:hypothetical protein